MILPSGTYYDENKANKALAYIASFALPNGKIQLLDWQKTLVSRIYGTINIENNLRYYKEVFLFLPTKNGKTTLASAFALLALLDAEIRSGEVYSAAPTREQAARAYDTIKGIISRSDSLRKILKTNDTKRRITNLKTGTYYQALASDASSNEGLNSDFTLIDELHAFSGRKLWDTLRNRQGAKSQPLTITITTAGPRPDPGSVCYQEYETAKKVLAGTMQISGYLPIVFEAGDDDDPYSEETWKKANPSLGEIKNLDELRRRSERAKLSTLEQRVFFRYDLNRWVDTDEPYIPSDRRRDCAASYTAESLHGRVCYAGLDLSSNIDLTSLCLLFPMEDGTYRTLSYSWVPELIIDDKEDKDRVPYRTWRDAGQLLTTSGETIEQDEIKEKIVELDKLYKIKAFGLDWAMAAKLASELQRLGFNVGRIHQGYSLSPGLKELERLVISKRLHHNNNAVLTWAVSNLKTQEGRLGDGAIMAIKGKTVHRIDPAVAMAISIQTAMSDAAKAAKENNEQSVYADRGILII